MKNLKLFFALCSTLTLNYASAQFCTEDNRFSNNEYFSSNEIESQTDVTYGEAVNWQGNSEELKLDFYYPDNNIDTMSSRPFILLLHGGGWEAGDKSLQVDESLEFAKRGYVTATINYRLGLDESVPGDVAKAIYRSQQDANAALRYCIDIANTIRIDTSWIFIGGLSAGSITSQFTTYADQEEWDSGFPGIESILGSLNNSGNNLTHTFTIKGIFNSCGAGPVDTKLDELKPMISFHGLLDNVVPIDTVFGGLLGSGILHNMLNDEGICNDFTIDSLGGHCIYNSSTAGTVFRVERASCFFKSLFCEDCTNFYSTETIPADCSAPPTSNVESAEINEVTVYPNPFNDKLNIDGLNGNEYFYLFDYFGRIVFEGNGIQNQNFRQLPLGPYLLYLSKDGECQMFKVLKN